MSIQCTELDILDDNILENNETFSLDLSNRSTQVHITTGRQQAQVIISEDDMDCK